MAEKNIHLKLCNKNENDEYETITVNSQEYHVCFPQLYKHSEEINKNYQKDSIKNFQKDLEDIGNDYNIKKDNLGLFMKIISGEEILITQINSFDLYKLSTLFKISGMSKKIREIWNFEYNKFDDEIGQFILDFDQSVENDKDRNIFNEFIQYTSILATLTANISDFFKSQSFDHYSPSLIEFVLSKTDPKEIPQDDLFDHVFKSEKKKLCLLQFLNYDSLSPERQKQLFLCVLGRYVELLSSAKKQSEVNNNDQIGSEKVFIQFYHKMVGQSGEEKEEAIEEEETDEENDGSNEDDEIEEEETDGQDEDEDDDDASDEEENAEESNGEESQDDESSGAEEESASDENDEAEKSGSDDEREGKREKSKDEKRSSSNEIDSEEKSDQKEKGSDVKAKISKSAVVKRSGINVSKVKRSKSQDAKKSKGGDGGSDEQSSEDKDKRDDANKSSRGKSEESDEANESDSYESGIAKPKKKKIKKKSHKSGDHDSHDDDTNASSSSSEHLYDVEDDNSSIPSSSSFKEEQRGHHERSRPWQPRRFKSSARKRDRSPHFTKIELNNQRVWRETEKIVKDGEYTDCNNKKHKIKKDVSSCNKKTEIFDENYDFAKKNQKQNEEMTRFTHKEKSEALSHIEVTQEGTFEAARRAIKERYKEVSVLNFASATKPGGGVKNGRTAQEETLSRQSSLYFSLVEQKQWYNVHLKQKKGNAFYTHNMIYSPHVVVFRDAKYRLVSPIKVSVITSAAVNYSIILKKYKRGEKDRNVYDTMKNRCRRILELGILKKNDAIVLGAFGCGVFKNKPEVISKIFRQLLVDEGYGMFYKKIIFAIKGKKGPPNENYEVFKETFQK